MSGKTEADIKYAEKTPWWHILIGVVCLGAVIAFILLMPRNKHPSPDETDPSVGYGPRGKY